MFNLFKRDFFRVNKIQAGFFSIMEVRGIQTGDQAVQIISHEGRGRKGEYDKNRGQESAGIRQDVEGALFRPMTRDGRSVAKRHMDRKTPWRLVKTYCRAAGINPDRLDGRGIGIHSLRKTAINDAIATVPRCTR